MALFFSVQSALAPQGEGSQSLGGLSPIGSTVKEKSKSVSGTIISIKKHRSCHKHMISK